MKNTLLIALAGIMIWAESCKKATTAPITVGLTASFGNATHQYLVPSGLVGYTGQLYTISGYQSDQASNSIVMTIDSAKTRIDSFTATAGNSLVIVNSGVTYATTNRHSSGIANVTVNGSSVTGTFFGTLYSGAGDSIVVTNGIISTTY